MTAAACCCCGLQLQRACEATARELSAVTADKVSLQQQLTQSQDSVDALAAELQDTLAKVDDKDTQLQALAEQLEEEQNQHNAAVQQVCGVLMMWGALRCNRCSVHLVCNSTGDTAVWQACENILQQHMFITYRWVPCSTSPCFLCVEHGTVMDM